MRNEAPLLHREGRVSRSNRVSRLCPQVPVFARPCLPSFAIAFHTVDGDSTAWSPPVRPFFALSLPSARCPHLSPKDMTGLVRRIAKEYTAEECHARIVFWRSSKERDEEDRARAVPQTPHFTSRDSTPDWWLNNLFSHTRDRYSSDESEVGVRLWLYLLAE